MGCFGFCCTASDAGKKKKEKDDAAEESAAEDKGKDKDTKKGDGDAGSGTEGPVTVEDACREWSEDLRNYFYKMRAGNGAKICVLSSNT